MNFTKYYGKDCLIALIVNFLLLTKVSIFLIILIVMTGDIIHEYYQDSIPDWLFFLVAVIACLVIFVFILLRLLLLPFLYKYFEKCSDEKVVLDFIHNLKSSWKWKVYILLLTLISPLVLCQNNFKQFCELILFTQFPSYIILFFWWWIEDLIKKRKMHNSNKIQVVK